MLGIISNLLFLVYSLIQFKNWLIIGSSCVKYMTIWGPMSARIHSSSLCSGHAFSFATAKRYSLGSTLRICNLFSQLPFEKLLLSVCYVRCTSGWAADVTAACDPVLQPCWSLLGWPCAGMVPVGCLGSRRSPWQQLGGESYQATFHGAQGVDVLCWLPGGPFMSPSSWGTWL